MRENEIIDFLTGNADEGKKSVVIDWVNSSEKNRNEFYRLKNLIALTGRESKVEQTSEDELNLLLKKISDQKRTIRIKVLTSILKYAAIIFVTLFVARILIPTSFQTPTNNKWFEVTTPSGQMAQISLPDGTKVWLNSRTNLRYPTSFSSKNREVVISGEAFFDVSHDKNSPFLVHTKDYSVKVIGTSFNVSAYSGDRLSETTLVEGSVLLMNTNNQELGKLEPGQLFKYDVNNKTYKLSNVSTEYYTSWKEGYYAFEHETLEAIAAKLERIYSVKIKIPSDKIKKLSFTGTIYKNKPLEQILGIIELTAPVEIKISHISNAEDIVTISPKHSK